MSDPTDEPTRSTPSFALSLVGSGSPAPLGDSALPFQRVPTNPGLAAAPAAFGPSVGVVLPRRPAPPQLGHPGGLIPLANFLASLGPLSFSSAAVSPGAPRVPAPAPTPFEPAGGHALGLEGAASDSPWLARAVTPSVPPAPGPAAFGAAGPAPGRTPTVDPALSANSPWLQTAAMVPSVLPSPMGDLPMAGPPSAAHPLPASPPQGGSRSLMTVALIVAALALIGAIVAVAMRSRQGSEDPADVKAGQAQRDYTLPESAPTVSATATASAASPPRPVFRAPQPATPAAPTQKPKDIYEDL